MSDTLDRIKVALADRYAIERELGSGGMAVVYLARDLKHERLVALKVLRPELAATVGAERFLREIRIAAQLNHPHILPLLDSGTVEESLSDQEPTAVPPQRRTALLYYVMPFVEGHSLREKLVRERELPISEAVRILRDVVDALALAHSHGVIHRDIKPDNVMLSGRHAMVTDFGVAKALSEASGTSDLTTAGVALGTPAYMSPEQAVADELVDHRSDIYAVGALAYELLTGRPPFLGTTPQMVLSAHVTDTPEPVTKYRVTVAPQLEHLVLRCLEKKPADRWQSAEELLVQLEAIVTPSGGMTPTTTRPVATVVARRRWLAPGTVAAAALVIVIVVVVSRMVSLTPITITTSNLRAVTSEPGIEWQPALSPDASQVVYQRLGADGMRLFIRSTINIAGGGELTLDQGEFSFQGYPAWSPDGEFVRFWACDDRCAWREIGRLGGAMRSLDVPGANELCSWSPDGSDIACPGDQGVDIYQIAERTTTRLTFSIDLLGPHTVIPLGLHSLAWSQDGGRLAFVLGNAAWITELNVMPSSVWIVATSGGEPVRVTGDEYMDMSPSWLDGNHLLFVSNRGGEREVYVGPTGPRGELDKVPGPLGPHSISYSIAGKKLAYARFEDRQNIWSFSLEQDGPVSIGAGQPVTTGNQVVEAHHVSPDGAWIVYDSNLGGNTDIYKRRFHGGDPIRLTSDPRMDFQPQWSPDGREIAFGSVRRGDLTVLMLVSADGGTPVEVPDLPEALNGYPVWSPSGLELAFISLQQGRYDVWLVTRDSVGGTWYGARQLTDTGCSLGDWTPDGSGVLCASETTLVLMSRDGETLWSRDLSEMHLTPIRQFGHLGFVTFSADGGMVYLVAQHNDGSDGIWSVPVRDGDPKLVVVYDGRFPKWQFSVDPEHIYVTVGDYESDIWVMDVEW